MQHLFAELRRRNVFRAAGLYAVGGWLLAQVAGTLEEALNLPVLFDTIVVSALLVGFPIALVLTWLFELGPTGLRLVSAAGAAEEEQARSARHLDLLVVGILLTLAGVIGWQLVRYNFADSAPATASQTPEPAAVEVAVEDTRPSIAVMAFEDFTAEADQAYFAKGISEELLNVLARVGGLRVPSRTSSFAFQGTNTPISEIGRALNVEHVLEGSVRKAGSTLRITAQLIDTRTDAHLWSETYDRPLTAENLFSVQDEIAAAVVQELSTRLQFVMAQNATSRTDSVEAYQLYLRAREAMNQRDPSSLRAAAEGYAQVIELAPDYAPAYSGLADAFLLLRAYGDMPRGEALNKARPLVERALALAPDSAEALTSAAFLAIEASEVEESLSFARAAIAANPNYASAYLRLGAAYEFVGQTESALEAYEQARLLDPLSPVVLSAISYSRMKLGDLPGALQSAEYNLRWNPDNFLVLRAMASLQYEMTDYATAHYYAKEAQALTPDASNYMLFDCYLQTGMYDMARRIAPADEDRALVATAEGSKAEALELLQPPDTGIHVNVLFYLHEFEAAYRTTTLREFIAAVLAQESALSKAQVSATELSAFIAQALDLAEAQGLKHKLAEYFGDAMAADYTLPDDLYSGAVWQVLQGRPEAAYAWLERFVELGYTSWAMGVDPVFEVIRASAAFEAVLARNDEIAVRQRGLIEAQLAEPKPNWIGADRVKLDGEDGETDDRTP
jgi:TolB-like protein/Flp pilus assembly protein TadD